MKIEKKMISMVVALVCAGPFTTHAQPDPESFLNHAMANPGLTNSTGEQFAWYANFRARYFVDAYLAYGDEAWLDAAVEYFDFVIDEGVSLDPDGYPGVIGALIGVDLSDPGVNELYDALVGDALIGSHITRFAEVVMDRPELHDRFLDKANEYIDLATEMVWTKWNERGTYYTDTRGYGSYHTHPYAIDRSDRSRWIPQPQRKISENLNKHYEAGVTILRLYRITGNPEYRDRVLELFGRAKAMFRLFPEEDRVVWNFWMPHGRWDMAGTTPASWVGVHTVRPFYQNIESRIFLEVYDSGLVFTEADMRRIVNTNLWMMDNGFVSADGTSNAGELWTGLARIEPRIRDAYEAGLVGSTVPEDVIRLDYLRNVTDASAGFERIHVTDPSTITVDNVAVQPGRYLSMATAIPDLVETINDDRIQLVARTVGTGPVTVELLSSAGVSLGELDAGTAASPFYTFSWDGTHPQTGERQLGNFRIRWTFRGETRTWPVRVIEGEEREPEFNVLRIRPGQTLHYDFDSPLDGRWLFSGAADVSDTRSYSGTHSLRLARRGRVDFLFGDPGVDLPVKVEFMVYDGGAQFGDEIIDGAMWGTRGSDDNLFVIAVRWRPFLAGDTNLNWINSGQNQLFSVWFMPLLREFGWSRWSFDYSNHPEPPVIMRNDEVIDNSWITDRGDWLPEPAIGAVFLGPDVGGAGLADAILYIDDVTVTHTGNPVSVFRDSAFTEDLGGGWKQNQLGFFHDSLFPWVYSVSLDSWIYVIGFTEWEGYHFRVEEGGYWAWTRGDLYPRYAVLSGDDAGEWKTMNP